MTITYGEERIAACECIAGPENDSPNDAIQRSTLVYEIGSSPDLRATSRGSLRLSEVSGGCPLTVRRSGAGGG